MLPLNYGNDGNALVTNRGIKEVSRTGGIDTRGRIAGNLDEILEVSKVNPKEPVQQDTKVRQFAKDGFEYRQSYVDVDGEIYRVRTNIGLSDGNKTFHTLNRYGEDRNTPAQLGESSVGSYGGNSDYNISQNSGNVNHFGQKSAEKLTQSESVAAKRTTTREAQNIYKAATKQQETLNGLLKDVSDTLGFKYEPAKQKSVESMVNKVNRKVAHGADYSVADIKDHTRGKVTMDSFADAPRVLNELSNRGIDYNIEAVENEWGYRGLHLTYRNEDGISSEIQLTTPEHWKTKIKSDAIYDKWRNFNKDATSASNELKQAYNKAMAESQDLWAKVDTKDFDSVAHSLSDTGRASWSVENKTLNEGLTQEPSSYTNTPGSPMDNANTLPSSVTQTFSRLGLDKSPNISGSPFNTNIAQTAENVKTSNASGQSRFAENTSNNDNFSDATRKALKQDPVGYTPTTNEERLARANTILSTKSIDEVDAYLRDNFFNVKDKDRNSGDVVLAGEFAKQLDAKGQNHQRYSQAVQSPPV